MRFCIEHKQSISNFGKSKLQVPDTGTQVLDNTRPFWRSSIVCFWMQPARSKERKYHIFRQYWYTRNVPVFTNTGTFQYLGPEVYFFRNFFPDMPHIVAFPRWPPLTLRVLHGSKIETCSDISAGSVKLLVLSQALKTCII